MKLDISCISLCLLLLVTLIHLCHSYLFIFSPKASLFQLGFRKRIEHIQKTTEDILYDYEVGQKYLL